MARGYGGSSITRIIERARISKTTFYARFASKEALFRAVMRAQVDDAAAAGALRPLAGSPDLENGLRTFADQMLQRSFSGRALELNRLIFSEAGRFPELGKAASQNLAAGIARVAEFLCEWARANGRPEARLEAVAETFIHALRGWYMFKVLLGEEVGELERRAWVEGAVATLVRSSEDWCR